jgi:hypothetical protein
MDTKTVSKAQVLCCLEALKSLFIFGFKTLKGKKSAIGKWTILLKSAYQGCLFFSKKMFANPNFWALILVQTNVFILSLYLKWSNCGH